MHAVVLVLQDGFIHEQLDLSKLKPIEKNKYKCDSNDWFVLNPFPNDKF